MTDRKKNFLRIMAPSQIEFSNLPADIGTDLSLNSVEPKNNGPQAANYRMRGTSGSVFNRLNV
jgi:hypothetical protein